MSKKRFINYEEIFKKIGLIPFVEQHILMLNANRSIGKTTGILKLALEKCKSDPNFKFAYGRYSTVELNNFVKNFNASYAPDFKSDGLNIFLYGYKYSDTKPVNSENKILSGWEYDDELKKYKKWDKLRSCGMVVNVSTPSNFLSMIVDGLQLFIFDEYNDFTDKRGIFQKFTELVATLQRNTTNLLCILLGNRRNANNEFMVKFGINPSILKYESNDDLIIHVSDNITFVDINPINYSSNGIGLAKALSEFDENLNNYYNNSSYLTESIIDVLNYKLFIKPYIVKRLFCIIVNNVVYEIGYFRENSIYISSENVDSRLNIYALREKDNINSKSNLYDSPREIIDFLFNNLKKSKLFYNSFDTKIDVEEEISWGRIYLENGEVNEY